MTPHVPDTFRALRVTKDDQGQPRAGFQTLSTAELPEGEVTVQADWMADGSTLRARYLVGADGGGTTELSLLGLVTVAASPGKPDLTLSRRRELVAAAAGASWHIDWVPELLTSEPTELAQWTPDYTPPPAKRFARPLAPTDAVPESVATAAAEVFAAAGEQWRNRPGKP